MLDWLIRNLNSHLRELDFAIQSVTLCVSLITASRPQQPQSAVVSASALLRASDRLQSMHAQGGDVTCSFGALYILGSGGDSFVADDRHACFEQQQPYQYQHYERDDDESSEVRSTLPLSTSTFLTDYDHFSVDPHKAHTPQRSHPTQPSPTPPAAERSNEEPLAAAAASPSATSPSSPSPSVPTRLPAVSSVPVCDVRAWLNESIIEPSEQYEQPTTEGSRDSAVHNAAQSSLPVNNRSRSSDKSNQSATWQRMYVAHDTPLMRTPHTSTTQHIAAALHSACPSVVSGVL